jgi:hypothetical protein
MTRRLPVLAVLAAVLLVLPSTLAADPDPPKPADSGAAAASDDDADRSHPLDHWNQWDESGDQEVSILSDLDVPAGKVHDGDVVCIGGNVTVAGEVTGDIVIIGGSLDVSGSVRGDVVGVGSVLQLSEGAAIDGQFVNVMGSLDNHGARISGEKVNIPFGLMIPGVKAPFAVLGAIIFWATVVGLALFFVAIFLFAALVPHRVRVLSEETPVSILWAFVIGLGVYAALPIVEFLLVCTVIGIPILLCLHVVFLVLKWLGMVGILHFLGSRLGRLFGRDFSLVGSILLAFVLIAAIKLVPFLVGGIAGLVVLLAIKLFVWLFLEVPGVGLIFLTRAGGRPRKREVVGTTAIAVPPVAPPPPSAAPS